MTATAASAAPVTAAAAAAAAAGETGNATLRRHLRRDEFLLHGTLLLPLRLHHLDAYLDGGYFLVPREGPSIHTHKTHDFRST